MSKEEILGALQEEKTYEIESRLRLLNPTKTKDELYLIFPRTKLVHRYNLNGIEYYYLNPDLPSDPYTFHRIRSIQVTYSSETGEKTYAVLNRKRMLDEHFPPTRMGVRIAIEEDIDEFEPRDLQKEIEKRETICKISGMRSGYRISNIGICRDTVYGEYNNEKRKIGEFIECGTDLNRKEDVKDRTERIEKMMKKLIEELNNINIKTEIEPRIYPEIFIS